MQQLIGINNNASDYPIWLLSLPQQASATVRANAETRGIITRLPVPAAAIVFTAVYSRKKITAAEKINDEISSENIT